MNIYTLSLSHYTLSYIHIQYLYVNKITTSLHPYSRVPLYSVFAYYNNINSFHDTIITPSLPPPPKKKEINKEKKKKSIDKSTKTEKIKQMKYR